MTTQNKKELELIKILIKKREDIADLSQQISYLRQDEEKLCKQIIDLFVEVDDVYIAVDRETILWIEGEAYESKKASDSIKIIEIKTIDEAIEENHD